MKKSLPVYLLLKRWNDRRVRHLPGPQLIHTLHSGWYADDIRELAMYLLNVLIAVDDNEFVLSSIAVEQVNGFVEKDIQAFLYRLAGIIRSLIQRAAIEIADTRYLWREAMNIIDMLVGATDISTRKPPEQRFTWNLQIDCLMDALSNAL